MTASTTWPWSLTFIPKTRIEPPGRSTPASANWGKSLGAGGAVAVCPGKGGCPMFRGKSITVESGAEGCVGVCCDPSAGEGCSGSGSGGGVTCGFCVLGFFSSLNFLCVLPSWRSGKTFSLLPLGGVVGLCCMTGTSLFATTRTLLGVSNRGGLKASMVCSHKAKCQPTTRPATAHDKRNQFSLRVRLGDARRAKPPRAAREFRRPL